MVEAATHQCYVIFLERMKPENQKPATEGGSKIKNLRPMDAVAALYGSGQRELSEEIVASLSRAIVSGTDPRPAGWLQRIMARVSYRLLKWTTSSVESEDEAGSMTTVFSNSVMERSGHPYARSLLASSKTENASLVEGGDPMNANYMLIAPEIRTSGGLWDRLLLGSVQGKDVRLRLALETRATYETAKRLLKKKQPIRLKAVAAGTGLSMILAYDKLVREGYDPDLITAVITDREQANIDMANRLLDKLATTKENRRIRGKRCGICAETEDIFSERSNAGAANIERYDVVTAIGILEYFQGISYATSGRQRKIETTDKSVNAHHLAEVFDRITTDCGSLIVNTMRNDPSTRILELFGRRFVYRNRKNLRSLLASVNFLPERLMGSGNIYDVEVYVKDRLHAPSAASAIPRGGA
jgi:hypothetical protein